MMIYLVRHGESTWNAERRWAGQGNPPLSQAGREQAFLVAEHWAEMNFDAVTSSSMQRARETAEIVAKRLQITLHEPVVEFDERHAGDLSGLTSSEIEVRHPGLLGRLRSDVLVEIPGGEAWPLFTERIVTGFSRFQEWNNQRLLLVAHAGVLRAVAHHLQEAPPMYGNLQGRWLKLERSGVLKAAEIIG